MKSLFDTLVDRLNRHGEATVQYCGLDGRTRSRLVTWGEKGSIRGDDHLIIWDVDAGNYRTLRTASLISVR
jgi:hypothetical protein